MKTTHFSSHALCLFLLIISAILGSILVQSTYAQTKSDTHHFAFGVIAHATTSQSGQAALSQAIAASDADNLAFVVVNGIKSEKEPCTDELYTARRDLLQSAENGIVVSLAASDWIQCKDKNQTSTAIERLGQLRELLFPSEFSFGMSKIPLLRQSITPMFRSYSENARWEFSSILFATINLPAGNNHFLLDGGRNSECADRLIANKEWLEILFGYANLNNMRGIVLFCDGNPLTPPHQRPFLLHGQRDGFAEIRHYLMTLTATFPGKILLVHSENLNTTEEKRSQTVTTDDQNSIVWQHNLGSIGIAPGWKKLFINDTSPQLFSLIGPAPHPN